MDSVTLIQLSLVFTDGQIRKEVRPVYTRNRKRALAVGCRWIRQMVKDYPVADITSYEVNVL